MAIEDCVAWRGKCARICRGVQGWFCGRAVTTARSSVRILRSTRGRWSGAVGTATLLRVPALLPGRPAVRAANWWRSRQFWSVVIAISNWFLTDGRRRGWDSASGLFVPVGRVAWFAEAELRIVVGWFRVGDLFCFTRFLWSAFAANKKFVEIRDMSGILRK